MKTLKGLVCCMLLLLSGQLVAQEAIVFSLEGKGKLILEEGGKQKLVAGDIIEPGAKLELKKKAEVGIYYNDAFAFFSGPATLTLDEILRSDDFQESSGNTIFGRQLVYASDDYFAKDVKFGFTGGNSQSTTDVPPPKKEKSGGGNKDRKIKIQKPLVGKISGKDLIFRWEVKDDSIAVKKYRYAITDEAGQEVYQAEVMGTTHQVSSSEAGLSPDQTYQWSVTALDAEGVDTGNLEIEFKAQHEFEQIRMRIVRDAAYIRASPPAKMLLESAFFERSGYLQAAKNVLDEARVKFKKYPLVQKMYSAFLWRNGIEE